MTRWKVNPRNKNMPEKHLKNGGFFRVHKYGTGLNIDREWHCEFHSPLGRVYEEAITYPSDLSAQMNGPRAIRKMLLAAADAAGGE